jgi:aspartate-semialdehyde dehydrogenase
VSGAGKAAVEELMAQDPQPKVFSHPIAFNCIPQIGSMAADGFCTEEQKIMRETKKILDRNDLRVSAWTVRIPALNSHSEAVWVTTRTPAQKSAIVDALATMPGVLVQTENEFVTAREASGKNAVFVGRIHQDIDFPLTWMLWIVADNIRKGAALNGLQIAERIFDVRVSTVL